MSKWVSVNDQLPSGEGNKYLVCRLNNIIEIAYFSGNKWQLDNDRMPGFDSGITHWMELPALPGIN